MEWFIVAIEGLAILGTSIWVFLDAHKKKRSAMWGVGCLLLYVVVCPIYLGMDRRTITVGAASLMWIAWATVLILWLGLIVQTI
jgi:hypothetical protein